MFNEIYPYKLRPEFINKKVSLDTDIIAIFKDESLLFKKENDNFVLPTFLDIKNILDKDFIITNSYYGLSIENMQKESDKLNFYLLLNLNFNEFNFSSSDFEFKSLNFLREFEPRVLAFATSTLRHIYSWLSSRKFCGRCASPNIFSNKERALLCPKCGQIEYPKINPAIIVAITNKDEILLTKGKHGLYPNYALVAGFIEIGEEPIDAVFREVKEEVGLNIKNIRSYKAQPWGFSNALMFAFVAELDGDPHIQLQKSELKEARWFKRQDVPVLANHISVGQEMIEKFKNNEL